MRSEREERLTRRNIARWEAEQEREIENDADVSEEGEGSSASEWEKAQDEQSEGDVEARSDDKEPSVRGAMREEPLRQVCHSGGNSSLSESSNSGDDTDSSCGSNRNMSGRIFHYKAFKRR